MDKNIAIQFNNVGKQYRLGLVGTGSLQHDLNRWWQTTILRREDPYLKIGEVNDRTKKANSDYVWALKDISFKVEQGDVVGIIGKNGAGKSTLLKLLSHITAPTTGTIDYRGRIASLLEVGTGFHPEMTARQNIYMNGSIMGMTRHEITSKLDEIIDFAGIERYIDTPVKRFSSGMTVRLGFAVAAFLEPEILVVDEVLAVGDAEFQKKAIGKMKDVSSSGGRTVLFVSHNMAAVKMLCDNGIVLKNGMIDKIGTAEECVDYYLTSSENKGVITKLTIDDSVREHYSLLNHDVDFVEAELLNENPEEIATDEPLRFRFKLKFNHNAPKFQICLFFINSSDVRVLFCMTDEIIVPKDKDNMDIEVTVPHHSLPRGTYTVRLETNLQHFDQGSTHFDFIKNILSFKVKYVHKDKKDEYLFWQSFFGSSLQLEEKVPVHIIS